MINNLKTKTENILLIDDEESCLISMRMFLRDSEYNLVTAINANEAWKVLNESRLPIELIFLDLMLPDIYGIDFLIKIKQDKNFSSIPVILQTGSSNWEEIKKAKDLGAISCIRKPYNREILLKIIKKTLSHQELVH
ncbi:MAG: response regulator [Alphaproteobacteria bacterium]